MQKFLKTNSWPWDNSPDIIWMFFSVYRDWMTMPKLVVSGSSDEFFLIDDYKYFFHDLPGESSMW